MAPQQYFLPSTSAEYKKRTLERRRKEFFLKPSPIIANQNWPINSKELSKYFMPKFTLELPLSPPPTIQKPLLPTKIHVLLPILLIFASYSILPISGQSTGMSKIIK